MMISIEILNYFVFVLKLLLVFVVKLLSRNTPFYQNVVYFKNIEARLFLKLRIQKQPPEVFLKKCVLKNFTKFTGKRLCWSLFFIKTAGLRPATLNEFIYRVN